jgi:SsrA-binding protein
MKEIQTNKKAFFDYEILSKLEVGIELQSYEIKQIVNKKCNIKGSFAKIINNEVFLFGMHIEKFDNAVFYISIEEARTRKLLLHKKEIKRLVEEIKLNQHLTLIPLAVYINDLGKAKITLGLCKGKKDYDKRQTIKEKDIKRNKDRE